MLLAMKKTYPPNQPVIELGLPPFVEIPIPDISKVMRDSNHSHWIFLYFFLSRRSSRYYSSPLMVLFIADSAFSVGDI